jgi:glutaredoxin-like protein NrdH
MEIKHIDGKNKGKIMLYALSTCVWCKKTKRLLNELAIAYDYVDVDLLNSAEREEINKKVLKYNPQGSYPTIIINEDQCVVGYDPGKIKEVIGNGQAE